MERIHDNSEEVFRELNLKSGGYESSLGLQMAIYFNSYLTPIWILCQTSSLNLKAKSLSPMHWFMASVSLVVLTAIDIPRLYLGYVGNVFDKVRHLLAFVLLSVLIQFPIHLFRSMSTIFGVLVTPFELIMDSIMFSLLLIQIILSINALSQSTKHQISERNKQDLGLTLPSHCPSPEQTPHAKMHFQ